MDCTQARTYLQAHFDGELDAVTSGTVDAHVAECANCRQALSRIEGLRSLIREGAPYYAAPEGLAQKIRAGVGAPRTMPESRPQTWRWLQPAALVAATAIVTWIAASYFNTPSREEIIAAQVVADHSRSMITSHLTDVASSDQHTVKPWLSSKLDFSPPVSDLTTAGFPLVGGRVEYLDNRPVAALVYKHRQHVIDLFIWPASETTRTAARAIGRQGYQVVHWQHDGMTFWAVSDLNAADLKSFVDTFSQATP